MNWSDGWSRPTRIVVTLFGMATIVGAVISPFIGFTADTVIPGVLVGAAWAVVGIKSGYPLVPTAGPDEVAVGLRRIRRRRLMMYFFGLVVLAAGGPAIMATPQRMRLTVFALVGTLFLIPFIVWVTSACPRCGRHFLIPSQLRLWMSQSRCQHCGLGLRDA
jgi:hypothetical protein